MASELNATESQPTIFALPPEEASLLAALGRSLASNRTWWGASPDDEVTRSVIAIESLSGDRYRVTFRDVVGVVRIGGSQIQVSPKIPLDHFLYHANHSQLAPRVTTNRASISKGTGFIELLARWCLDAAEELLRAGLRKDYKEYADELDMVRGRLLTLQTAMRTCHEGRAVAVCEYEDLSDDAPLNRVVRSACQRITRLDPVSNETRRRARHVAYRMDGIGPAQSSDLRTNIDRLSKSYSRVIPLAKLILNGCGISAAFGPHVASSFLVRTPELIEDGLRAIISEALPELEVRKRRLVLHDTGISMNPDLVFGENHAIGDVKYRFLSADWNRADLNQVVTFATAFHSPLCGLFGFVRAPDAPRPRAIPVGSVRATAFGWIAAPFTDPADSAARLALDVKSWLQESKL